MIELIVLVLINQVYWFFPFEIIVMNILFAAVIIRQEKISALLLNNVKEGAG